MRSSPQQAASGTAVCGKAKIAAWLPETSEAASVRSPPALDTIALFGEAVRSKHERDQALEEVAKLRDAGKIRDACAKLKAVESLHERVVMLENELKLN
jgi:hypothetical protein